MNRGDENERNARQVVDALAALFARDLPDTRHEAEAELREAGVDPVQVGRRFERLAEIALGPAVSVSSMARSPLRPGSGQDWSLGAAKSDRLLGEADSEAPMLRGPPIAFDDVALIRTPSSNARPLAGEQPIASGTLGGSQRPSVPPRRWILGRPLGAIAALCVVFVLGYVVGRDRMSGNTSPLERMPAVARLAAPSVRGNTKAAEVFAEAAGEAHRGYPLAPPPDTAGTLPPPDVLSTGTVGEPAAPGSRELAASDVEGDDVGSVAEVDHGEVITRANVDRVRDLISPGVEWCVRHGLTMRIVPYRKVRWNAAYREATLKYGGLTRLSADGRSLVGYVAGLPFLHLDPNDPQLALKIMWNYQHRPYVTDDWDLRNSDADTGPVTGIAPMQVERHFLIDHERSLAYTGRLYIEPKPELPNPDKVLTKNSRHPILEPFDLKGVGLTTVRYLSPERQDDTWLYLPTLRRVRRLSSAQRSDALFGQDADVDSDGGFAGQLAWFDWKYLGEKEILASFHAEYFPVKYCEGGGDFVFCDTWEPRKVYVIEGVPKLPQYAYGKRVLYIDKETYHIAYSDIYDRSGQLWKVWINQWSFKKRAAPSYGSTYEDEMPFHPSVTMVDMQVNHATRAALPSSKYPGEEGWYFNQGNKSGGSDEFFTIAHLIESGH